MPNDKKPTDEPAEKPVEKEPTTAPELEAVPESEASKSTEVEEESDPETDKAVDEIAAQDSDDLLAAQDEQSHQTNNKKAGKWQRFKRGWSNWWHNPLKRRATLAGLAVALLVVGVVPSGRYFVLNNIGIRSSASVIVVDDSTQQPLKNVAVTLGSQTAATDIDGRATFKHLRLGKTKLTIKKRAFATSEKFVTIGWGSNPLVQQSLRPIGTQYSFRVTDYLSGLPLENVEALSGEANALSDAEGKIVLTLDFGDEDQSSDVEITAEGYRTETISLSTDSEENIAVQLVPERSHIFISKRSGRYDVYKIDADGKNEEKILAGSGIERDDLTLVAHPTKAYAALVSTRENVRRDGYLLQTLTLIDIAQKTPSKLAQSERVQIVDWLGDRLVYVQIAAGASAEDPDRHQLMSYDLDSGESKQLATANYFNDVIAVGNNIYYAPSGAYSSGDAKFYKIAADGSGKTAAYNSEVWNIFRTAYDKLVLAVGQDWYEYVISSGKTTHLSGEPSNLDSKVYIDSPDRKRSLWVDQRDGKGVLLAYDVATQADKTIHTQSGLNNPVTWLNNSSIVFRVATSNETADYVMSLNGGEPKKLKDVTNTSGVDNWYYY